MRDKRTNPRLKPSLCKCIAPFSPPAVFHRRRRRIRLKFGYRFVINILMIVQRTRFRNPFQSFFTFSLFLFSKGSGGSFRSAAGQDVLFPALFLRKKQVLIVENDSSAQSGAGFCPVRRFSCVTADMEPYGKQQRKPLSAESSKEKRVDKSRKI